MTYNAQEAARDRVRGLAVHASLRQAQRTQQDAQSRKKLGSSSAFDRRDASREMASTNRADLHDIAKVSALVDILGRNWSRDAAPTLDMLTMVLSAAETEKDALAIVDEFGKSDHYDGSVKLPLARDLIRQYFDASSRTDNALWRDVAAAMDGVLSQASTARQKAT